MFKVNGDSVKQKLKYYKSIILNFCHYLEGRWFKRKIRHVSETKGTKCYLYMWVSLRYDSVICPLFVVVVCLFCFLIKSSLTPKQRSSIYLSSCSTLTSHPKLSFLLGLDHTPYLLVWRRKKKFFCNVQGPTLDFVQGPNLPEVCFFFLTFCHFWRQEDSYSQNVLQVARQRREL